MKKVKLPANLIEKLNSLPEQGMGNHIVDVTLNDGVVLKYRNVVNSSYLLLEQSEDVKTSDIKDVNLAKYKI